MANSTIARAGRPARHFLLASLLSAAAALVHGQAKPPNFLIILSDDQGYADVGVYGSGSAPAGKPWNPWDTIAIRTPRLDKMASEGMRFTDFYASSMVCSPSRSGLLTGSHPFRVYGPQDAVYYPNGKEGLNPNEVTLADLLKRRGYATAAVGKWHQGDAPKFLPTRQGFDTYYGVPYSNDMIYNKQYAVLSDSAVLREGWTREKIAATADTGFPKNKVPLLRGEQVVEYPADQPTLTKRYADEGIRFIAKSAAAGKPFFLYLAPNMPHYPVSASAAFAGKSPRGTYGDAIEELDYNIGRILDTLKALGLDGNTLISFSSDNGPWLTKGKDGGTAYPLRDGKFTTWEGGQRVPGLIRWTGHVPAGSVQKEIASAMDLYPTFAKLAGIPLPTGESVNGHPIVIDGADISDMILGKPGATRGKPFILGDGSSVRQGDWKLRDSALFDLATDIHEDHDLSASNPAKKAELVKIRDDWKAGLVFRGRGTLTSPDPVPGCTDVSATNFNAAARRDDGSCKYKTTAIGSLPEAGFRARCFRSGDDLVIRLPWALPIEIREVTGRGPVLRMASSQSHLVPGKALAAGAYFIVSTERKRESLGHFVWP